MRILAGGCLLLLLAQPAMPADADWRGLSERTRADVYRMEARVNGVPADPAGRQRAYEDYMATFSPGVVVHGLVPGATDHAGVRRFYAGLFGTLRDSVLVSDELIVAGPMAAQRYHAVGRMTGEFDGVVLDDRLVALRGQTFFRLGHDGRIVERWSNHDHGYRMAQTVGPEGRVRGEQLARELNGPGLDEQAVYARLAALEGAMNQVQDPEGRERAVLALFDPAAVVHDGGPEAAGMAGLLRDLRTLWEAFPDLVVSHEARLSAWSMGAVRWRGTGSRRGAWQDGPADWLPVLLSGEMIMRYGDDGRIVELWTYLHPVRLLEQAAREGAGPRSAPGLW
jgi:predicted ester cyclase